MKTTSERDFWVKRSTYVSAIGLPIAVFTTGFCGQLHPKLWGEYFLFVSGQQPYSTCQRVLVKTGALPEGLVTFDQTFMQSELEQQVNGALSAYLYRAYTGTNSDIFLESVQLDQEGAIEDIIGLWMRGLFHDEIRRVRKATWSHDLKKLLDYIVDLPTFSSSTHRGTDE